MMLIFQFKIFKISRNDDDISLFMKNITIGGQRKTTSISLDFRIMRFPITVSNV